MYDLIILGGGPAGLSAGIYAARYKLDTILLEKEYFSGGQVLNTWVVENYPGFKEIKGDELAKRMEEQAEHFGLEIKQETVKEVTLKGEENIFKTAKNEYKAKTAIIATGSKPRMLNIPGEKEFYGKGVSYCGTCDAPFYKDKVVAVIGGGNTAVDEALYLTKYTKKVYLIHRRDELRADKILQDKAFENPKIELIWNSVAKEIDLGEDDKHVFIHNKKTEEDKKLAVDGVFVFIGYKPNNELFKDQIELNQYGFIRKQKMNSLETNIPGVFAAGDILEKELRQIVIAAGDGAKAAFEANEYITKHN
ncbi:MAG: thioredoxin-disulfide reductase [Candidatus Cloacimonetes bacterium]|nr:thioredoxin-disulfide reductase [Candidatus Cloacimonadota bacterium]